MNEYITIPLSKRGKHKDKYEAIIDPCDKDLSNYEWNVLLKPRRAYARRSVRLGINQRKTALMHQIILERILGRELEPHEMPDHVNNNGLDNRRENLRVATALQNAQNTRIRADNTSGAKGVRWRSDIQKWQARITVNGKRIVVANCDSFEEAKQAHKEASIKYHKEFAKYIE